MSFFDCSSSIFGQLLLLSAAEFSVTTPQCVVLNSRGLWSMETSELLLKRTP